MSHIGWFDLIKICVYFAKGFWTDIRETNFIIMFNFILRNSVLSVPIVNGTKFIVLFLSSLGNFLLKKKRQRLLSVSSGQLKAVISVFGLGRLWPVSCLLRSIVWLPGSPWSSSLHAASSVLPAHVECIPSPWTSPSSLGLCIHVCSSLSWPCFANLPCWSHKSLSKSVTQMVDFVKFFLI